MESDEAKILRLIEKRSEATVNGDLELLDTLLSDDFRYVNKWGDLIEREMYFANKKSNTENGNKWISQNIDQVRVEVIDANTALVNFRVLDRQLHDGREMSDYVRTSYVCKRVGVIWLLTFGQTSPVVD